MSTFKDGDQLMVHVASMGTSAIPYSPQVVAELGKMMGVELNMLDCVYRGEDETDWILDVMSVDPPLMNSRLRKDGVDIIGVKSSVGVVTQKLVS